MKRMTIIPVECNFQIIIETEIDKEELESTDVLLCMEVEVIKELKRILVESGIKE
jgi:hypothetical protein